MTNRKPKPAPLTFAEMLAAMVRMGLVVAPGETS